MVAVPNSSVEGVCGPVVLETTAGAGGGGRRKVSPFVFGLQHHGFSVHSLIYAEVAANKVWRRRYGNQGL
jgi:hypothetical protein